MERLILNLERPTDEPELVAAVTSPRGVGGVAVIQVAGPGALAVTRGFLKTPSQTRTLDLPADQLKLARWMDGEEHVDDVIVVTDDPQADAQTVCITTHGSVRVVERILMSLQSAGARVVSTLPTETAWADLSSIEAAVMTHLPRAQTKRIALWLTRQITELPPVIEEAMELLLQGEISSAVDRLEVLMESYDRAQVLLDGARVVIVGPPNVGKSTLANRLFEKPWSIESEEAGTTRDWVHHPIAIDGIPIVLADTAGLRADADPIEEQAIRLAQPVIRSADVQILVLDATGPATQVRKEWLTGLLDRRKLVVVLNKSDLVGPDQPKLDVSKISGAAPAVVSALHGHGLENLRRVIVAALFPQGARMPVPCIWDVDHRRKLGHFIGLAPSQPAQAAKLLSRTFLGMADREIR
ncbi:MAG: GTP-binding protein [Planctomycetes bacterium]|nr:GTP-binding protein [Planctomycetota bacterium]